MFQFLKITILILLSIFLFSCSGSYEPPKHLIRHPQINIAISLNKDEYVEGEAIWLIAKFKNFGKLRDSLPDIYDGYTVNVNLKIESDSAPPVKYCGPVTDRISPIYSVIKAGETSSVSTNIRQFWVNKYLGKGLFYGYIVKGNYSIECRYSSGWSEDGVRISSNKLTFRVTEPSEITSQFLDSLVSIFKSNNDYGKQLYRFYEKHPKSAYAEDAFYYYTVMRILDNNKIKVDSTFLNECYQFFDDYPCSYFRCEILRQSLSAYRIINGRNQKNNKYYLNVIKSKYPELTYCVDRLIKNDADVRNSIKWYMQKFDDF